MNSVDSLLLKENLHRLVRLKKTFVYHQNYDWLTEISLEDQNIQTISERIRETEIKEGLKNDAR